MISKRLRNKILDTIAAAQLDATNERCADFIDNPPEMWEREQREIFDAMATQGDAIARRVQTLLCAESSAKKRNRL